MVTAQVPRAIRAAGGRLSVDEDRAARGPVADYLAAAEAAADVSLFDVSLFDVSLLAAAFSMQLRRSASPETFLQAWRASSAEPVPFWRGAPEAALSGVVVGSPRSVGWVGGVDGDGAVSVEGCVPVVVDVWATATFTVALSSIEAMA